MEDQKWPQLKRYNLGVCGKKTGACGENFLAKKTLCSAFRKMAKPGCFPAKISCKGFLKHHLGNGALPEN
ncbi:hypothetical protein AMTR_s00070p00051900 [Amborella trichopoda]|uniref:Uncharacterized protein n=1 Tax=Amborella trichopoda TaxID=13333 RepID=U5DDG6_AMBTC|nr:hypothetical protein AMTR_s00070p00051900 [Amborella trichopoda]